MSKIRRIGVMVAATIAALGMSMTVATAPASAAVSAKKAKGPVVINQWLHVTNAPTWVDVWWKTDKAACDFKLKVWGNSNVAITYPSNNATYTSFSNGPDLQKWEKDRTAFNVDANYASDRWVLLYASYSYRWCGTGKWEQKTTGFLLSVNA